MADINNNNHVAIIINSLGKIYNQAKINGILHANDLYLLDAINKLLGGCEGSIVNKQRMQLISLYNKTLNTSKYVCKDGIKREDYVLKKHFTVRGSLGKPIVTNIYYWQENNTSITNQNIINNVNTVNYLNTKSFDSVSAFQIGKTISYTNVGLISFAITNSLQTDNYRIYDILNNDITESFTRSYLDNKTILFISNNIYSYGDLFIKLTKSLTPLILSGIFTSQFTNQFT